MVILRGPVHFMNSTGYFPNLLFSLDYIQFTTKPFGKVLVVVWLFFSLFAQVEVAVGPIIAFSSWVHKPQHLPLQQRIRWKPCLKVRLIAFRYVVVRDLKFGEMLNVSELHELLMFELCRLTQASFLARWFVYASSFSQSHLPPVWPCCSPLSHIHTRARI